MVVGREFFSNEDMRRKLNASICMYKGDPYYVITDNQKGNTVKLYELGNNSKVFEVDYTDDAFDYSSPPLGYINAGSQAYYLSRIPDRKARQGLSADAIWVEPAGFYVADYFNTKAMEKCVLGEHPRFSNALEGILNRRFSSRAFHRHMALSRSTDGRISVLYKGRTVATKDFYSDSFHLIPSGDYSFLKKIVDRCGVPLC